MGGVEVTAKKLRDNWTQVRLGDVIDQVKDKVDREESAPDVYVPGGAIGRHNFSVSEWCRVDDGLMGPAFHMVVQPSDVLYKSRVPHGVAVADRKGICANTTYVLRTRDPGVLLQELIPYLLSTSTFLEFESLNDKGSTNLYLNFSDIAQYEFALPALEEQRRIVRALAEVGELEFSYLAVREKSHAVGSALLERTTATSPMERVIDLVAEIRAGSTPRRSESGYYEGSIPWLKSGEVDSGRISKTAECVTERALAETPIWVMPIGAVVVAMYGDGKTAGSVGILEKPMACNQAVLGLVADQDRVLPDYLYWVLRSQKESLRNQRAGSSQANLNKVIVGNFRIPVPPLNAQYELLAEVSQLEGLARLAGAAQVAAGVLGTSLRERLLMGHHV